MVNRRNILKGAGVGMAAVAAPTSAASAAKFQTKAATEAELERLEARFQDAAAVEELVNAQDDLLDELVAADVLESAEIGDLDELTPPEALEDGDLTAEAVGEGEELTRYAPAGERWTPKIHVFRSTARGQLTISVFPELDAAYAALKTSPPGQFDGQDDVEVFGDPEQVQPDACWCGCECAVDCGDCEYECCDLACTNLCEVCGGCECEPCSCGACCLGQC